MRPHRVSSSLLAGVLLAATAARADTTVELRHELLALGDFNGDGRTDVAIVDRDSGQFRVAHFSAAGVPAWGGPFHSGVAPAEGVAAGRLLAATRDALAVTGEATNRANVFDLATLAQPTAPLSLFAPQVGPSGVVAAQMSGSASALAEAALFYTDNGATPQARTLFSFSGSPVTAATFHTAVPATNQLRPRKLDGFAGAYGAFSGAKPTDTFRVVDLATAGYPELAALAGVPFGAECVHADFDGASTTSPAQFVFYVRGSATLSWSRLRASNVFDPLDSAPLPLAIEQVTAVPRAGGTTGLLIAFSDGSVRMYAFDGAGAPTLLQTFPLPASGAPWTAAVAVGAGDFWLLSASGGRTAAAARFTWNGSTHVANGTTTLPALTTSRATSNVFAFTADPLVTDGAQLLGTFSAGDWTKNGSLLAGNLRADRARFVSATAGLGTFDAIVVGPAPAGTGHVLTNQLPSGVAGVPSYASAFGPTPAVGLAAGDIVVTPAAGSYPRAVKPVLTGPAGMTIYWRLSANGAWVSNAVQPPPWQIATFTLRYYGRTAGGVTTPVQSARFEIAGPPGELDSDRDGVPDYVELAYGLDPTAGADSDGDGASDLAEILSGTNPLSAASFPTRPDGPAGAAPLFPANYDNTFTLRMTPAPLTGVSRYAATTARSAGVHVHDLAGTPLGSANTHVIFNYATVAGVPGPFAGTFWGVGTDEQFTVLGGAGDSRNGRELVGLVPVPKAELGAVPYAYGGGSNAVEAAAWRTAALAHYGTAATPILETLDATDTLVLLLTELKLEQILKARGELLAGQALSLTPWRGTETTVAFADRAGAAANARVRLAPEDLIALRRYAGTAPSYTYTFGWLAETIRSRIADDFAAPPTAAVTRLKTVAQEFYFLSAAATDAQLPAFPSPVDALRAFVRTGVVAGDLDSDGVRDFGETQGYWPTATLTPAQFTEAFGAVSYLLARPAARPVTSGTFLVDAATFATEDPVVRALVGAAPWALLEADGDAFPLSSAFDLGVGAELSVQGFTDVVSPDAANALEVIGLSLTSLPPPPPADLDGDLLGDSWAAYFFPGGSGGPWADGDGDGFNNLEEYLQRTDPANGGSVPAGSPADLRPPPVKVLAGGGAGELVLEFRFPAGYAERFAFHLQSTTSLLAPFAEQSVRAVHQGGGLFRVSVFPSAEPARFWRFRMALK